MQRQLVLGTCKFCSGYGAKIPHVHGTLLYMLQHAVKPVLTWALLHGCAVPAFEYDTILLRTRLMFLTCVAHRLHNLAEQVTLLNSLAINCLTLPPVIVQHIARLM